jgi:hypothetical protein
MLLSSDNKHGNETDFVPVHNNVKLYALNKQIETSEVHQ